MSQDLLSTKPGKRNWARGAAPASPGKPAQPTVPVVAGPLPAPARKIAKGAMILGTVAGLAFITSPWWKPLPQRPDPMRRRIYGLPASPSDRINWSRR